MTKNERADLHDQLMRMLEGARQWNNSDIRDIDEITPNKPMLLARRRVILHAMRLGKALA